MKKLLLPLFAIAILSSCTKNKYNCTCVTQAAGYVTETNVQVLTDTKSRATTTCKTENYTSQTGDVVMTCTLN